MSRGVNEIDFQEKIGRRKFTRVVGGLHGKADATFHVPEAQVTIAFGPTQIRRGSYCWNFVTRDGKTALSLFAKPKGKTVDLVSRGNFSQAYIWTSDRLYEAEYQPMSQAC